MAVERALSLQSGAQLCGSIPSTTPLFAETHMKRKFGKKFKKSPKPPPQPVTPGNTHGIASGPPRIRPEPGAVPEGVYSPYRYCWQIVLI